MKKYFAIASLVAIFAACTNTTGRQAEERKSNFAEMLDKPTSIEFDEMEFDFGKVKDGEPVNYVFKFKNTGSEILVLLDAKAACGCTVPVWPKEPIPPGGTGEINVTFDSENRVGMVRKTIRIQANTEPSITTLVLSGEVVEKF